MHILLWRYIWFCARFWKLIICGPEFVLAIVAVWKLKVVFAGSLAGTVITYGNVGCGASVMLLGFVTRWATPGFLAHLKKGAVRKHLADVHDPERLTFRLTWSATVHWILILLTLFRSAVTVSRERVDDWVLFLLVYSFANFLSVIALTGVVSCEWTKFRMHDHSPDDDL